MKWKKAELKSFLDEKVEQYNAPSFIPHDPIQIPHRFSLSEDIEIASFLTATIAWGQRVTIINNANRLMAWMDESPADFILHHKPIERSPFDQFVHRTFNGDDAVFFLASLQNIYKNHGGLRQVFVDGFKKGDAGVAISHFREVFFGVDHLKRSQKHVSNPAKGSSAKRLNMFLRWMVRKDTKGVDFGLWNKIPTSKLMLPLDVHTGNVSRKLGLLKRKQSDWKSVEELTANLRKFDAEDPIKYDFALFGLGAMEKF